MNARNERCSLMSLAPLVGAAGAVKAGVPLSMEVIIVFTGKWCGPLAAVLILFVLALASANVSASDGSARSGDETAVIVPGQGPEIPNPHVVCNSTALEGIMQVYWTARSVEEFRDRALVELEAQAGCVNDLCVCAPTEAIVPRTDPNTTNPYVVCISTALHEIMAARLTSGSAEEFRSRAMAVIVTLAACIDGLCDCGDAISVEGFNSETAAGAPGSEFPSAASVESCDALFCDGTTDCDARDFATRELRDECYRDELSSYVRCRASAGILAPIMLHPCILYAQCHGSTSGGGPTNPFDPAFCPFAPH